MEYEHRQYQEDAAIALYTSLKVPGNKPVIAIPTGAGKTVIMGLFLQMYLKDNPDNEILVLSHTQNIVDQDYKSLVKFFPRLDICVFSAGLGSKEKGQITVGGIQSVIKSPDLFRWANLVIVDEVHSVNHKGEGSYRKLLDNMHARITGMSATVFRSGHGYIYKGKGTIFNDLAYDLTSVKNFNKLVDDGYLSRLISVAPPTQLDSSKVKKSAGDYNVKSLSETHDTKEITQAAIKDALQYGKNYNHWLVFAIDIEHADHICDSLNLHGVKSAVLHSRINGDRSSIINNFNTGKVRALVSVGMITTGFDSPSVDLILMLRPTMSAVLHVQMVGRGLRIAPKKKHCLVLDYAGNTERLGPINNVLVPKTEKSAGKGEAPTKTCPKCRTITYTRAKTCESCGHEFVFESKLSISASTEDIVEGKYPPSKERWLTVKNAKYTIHRKGGSPDSLLVTYNCGLARVKEWICVDHSGFAGKKAKHVLKYRGYSGPLTTADAFSNKDRIAVPKRILVNFSNKYPVITNAQF